MKKILVLITMTLLFLGSQKTAEAAIQNNSQSPANPEATITSNEETATNSDVYEALLKTKDDKIILLINYVNWLIAIAAIAVTIVAFYNGWANRKLRKASDEAARIISSLEKKESEIAEAQKRINSILQSGDIETKVSEFEKKLEILDENNKKIDTELKKLRENMRKNYEETAKDQIEDSSSILSTIEVSEKEGVVTDREYSRGDIYVAKVPYENSKSINRPVLIIQNDIGNKFSSVVTVIPLKSTSSNKHTPLRVPISLKKRTAYADVTQIMTISKEKLTSYVGTVSMQELKDIHKAMQLHFSDLENI